MPYRFLRRVASQRSEAMKRMRHNHGATFKAQKTFADKKVTGFGSFVLPYCA